MQMHIWGRKYMMQSKTKKKKHSAEKSKNTFKMEQ